MVSDGRARQSRQTWVRSRRSLNARRRLLADIATRVYPTENRLGDTGLVAHPEWLPDEPVDIRAIQLHHQPAAADLAVDGTEPETDHVRPRTSLVRRYARYTQAIRDLAPPRLFENRVCWRLLGLSWAGPTPELRFTDTTYFAAVDVSEAASHELALVALDGGGESTGRPLALRDLPFRRAIGDPFDLTRRPVMTAISTLTIRRDGPTASFLLHRRNARSVAIAGGMLQVIPSGIFQPSSVLPAAAAADFDLWRNIMREYSEELLGNADHDGDGRPVRYDREPFRTMAAALADGSLRVHCLGIALDALSLVGEIMTVAVWDAARYDALAGDFVEHNDEGALVGEQMSFDEATVTDLLRSRRLAPAGSGCLHLAWQFRDGLLRRT